MFEHWKRIGIGLLLIALRSLPIYSQEPAKAETKAQSIDELLLFFPSKYPTGNWQPTDLKFQDVKLAAEDGTKLHGWYCPSDKPRAVVLIAHGNAGHVAGRASWLRYLQKSARVSVFMFDYRGYGRSEGTPTVEGVLMDARAARKQLGELASVKEKDIVLMGESLGGAVMVQLAAESAPRGLILQSTFSSLRDVADVHYPGLAWLVSKNRLTRQRRSPTIAVHSCKATATSIAWYHSLPPRSSSKPPTSLNACSSSRTAVTRTG